MPDLPEIEVMRDTVHDVGFENFPPMTDNVDDRNSLTRSEQIMMEKGTVTPPVPDALASGGSSLPYHHRPETATSADLQNAAVFPDEHVLFGATFYHFPRRLCYVHELSLCLFRFAIVSVLYMCFSISQSMHHLNWRFDQAHLSSSHRQGKGRESNFLMNV